MALAATASADVPRYQSQTATFTRDSSAGAVGQWDNVWTHDYKVTVNPCDGTFTGTGKVDGHDHTKPSVRVASRLTFPPPKVPLIVSSAAYGPFGPPQLYWGIEGWEAS